MECVGTFLPAPFRREIIALQKWIFKNITMCRKLLRDLCTSGGLPSTIKLQQVHLLCTCDKGWMFAGRHVFFFFFVLPRKLRPGHPGPSAINLPGETVSPMEISWWTQAITKFALTVPNDVSCLTSHSSLATPNLILSRAALGPDVCSSILLCEHAFALLKNMLIRTNSSHIISMLSVHNHQPVLHNSDHSSLCRAQNRFPECL